MTSRLLIHLSIAFLLAGCSTANLSREVADAGIHLGSTEEEIITALGAPERQGTKDGYRYLSYCNTDDSGVKGGRLIDFVLLDNKMIRRFSYSNTRFGHCSNFFRPIDWDAVDRQAAALQELDEKAQWSEETYNIDLLKITQKTRDNDGLCASGGIYRLLVQGVIEPDSSFAMDALLERLLPCQDKTGKKGRAQTPSATFLRDNVAWEKSTYI